MSLFKNKCRSGRTTRFRHWDYSAKGHYFVTICVKDRECVFGNVKNGIMGLNEFGLAACEQWIKTETLRKNVTLDEWVVMPNHLHGIVVLNGSSVGTRRGASLRNKQNQFGPLKPNSLQSIINHFKGALTRQIRKNGHYFQWQSRFYDHVIRNKNDLLRIQKYIQNNPKKWEQDRNNPENVWM